MNKLPDLPSELITLALGDFDAVCKDDKYVISMGTWHTPEFDESGQVTVCHVCLAGAVMVRYLDVPIGLSFGDNWHISTPGECELDAHTIIKLQMLNDLRLGYVRSALGSFLDLDISPELKRRAMHIRSLAQSGYNWDVPEYRPENHDWFVSTMKNMAAALRMMGL